MNKVMKLKTKFGEPKKCICGCEEFRITYKDKSSKWVQLFYMNVEPFESLVNTRVKGDRFKKFKILITYYIDTFFLYNYS